ncbi:MAG: 3-hydroxyacyl-CoA dehydrogenase family protein [Chloroflexi bacterium]|nr:3-hydroxyacyl-CoA dehydrogenase family protein [Chloroflexota bacterium]
MEIRQVGIIGFGTMGTGIAQLCSTSGHSTLVLVRSEERQNRGLNSIKGFLDRSVQRGDMSAEDRDAALGRISFTSSLEDIGACDVIIESVTENVEVKRELYRTLSPLVGPNSILASNTSSVPIAEMAAVTTLPDRVCGIHFFNPAPLMKAVEVIRAITTSDETVERARAFGESLGKTVLMCKDQPGFLINRMLWPYLLDAVRIYEAGMATREDIDNAAKLGLNYRMGPLELADLLGLDVLLGAAEVFYNELRDPRFAAPTLLRRMVLAGHLGRKTGKGFYDYSK